MEKKKQWCNFQGDLGEYRVVKTDDGSQTLHSTHFDEACHSTHGAYAETVYNYIEGCEIAHQLQEKDELWILDVGFGAGLGARALIDLLEQLPSNPKRKIHYLSVELDQELTIWALEHGLPQPLPYSLMAITEEVASLSFNHGQLLGQVLIGDARQTIPAFKQAFPKVSLNAIFQDAFSPKKNPSLWTQEWFELLKSFSAPDALMTTYSASIGVRKAMFQAGWPVFNFPGFGQKRQATKCVRGLEMNPEMTKKLTTGNSIALKDCLIGLGE